MSYRPVSNKFHRTVRALGADLVRVMICHNAEDEKQPALLRYPAFLRQEVYDLILAACRHGQQTGEIRTDEPAEQLIENLVATLTGLLLYWGAANQEFDLIAFQTKNLRLLLETR